MSPINTFTSQVVKMQSLKFVSIKNLCTWHWLTCPFLSLEIPGKSLDSVVCFLYLKTQKQLTC